MEKKPIQLDYASRRPAPPPPRIWGMTGSVWMLLAGFCIFAELVPAAATNGHINGWGDIVYTLVFATIGAVAFLNAFWLLRRAR